VGYSLFCHPKKRGNYLRIIGFIVSIKWEIYVHGFRNTVVSVAVIVAQSLQ
jgi:hypothetical protein